MTKASGLNLGRVALLALTPALLLVAGCVTGGKDGAPGATGRTGATGATGDTGNTGETGPARTVIIER